jgi:acyl-CoA thioesterase FadM
VAAGTRHSQQVWRPTCIIFTVVSLQIDYCAPARLDDTLHASRSAMGWHR